MLAGTWPEPCQAITRAAREGDTQGALRASAELIEIWKLFGQYGSLRVVAAIAECRGLTSASSLPLPVKPLSIEARDEVANILRAIDAR